jgi:3-dehydroquinate dehydratase / shikimate dehydrogenase
MGFPICLSIFGNTESLLQIFQKYNSSADLFEVRLDLSDKLDLALIRKNTTKPLIFASHNDPDLLNDAVPFADYIDVGNANLSTPTNKIVSFHGKDEHPNELWQKLSRDHLTKIVLETVDYSKIAALLELNESHPQKAICFATGEVGAFSRILSVFKKAPWIYSSISEQPTAPGQFSIDQLINTYHVKRFSSAPSVFGILGNPVSHSRSPAFQNQKFTEHNLSWIYLPFPCLDLESLMNHRRQFGIVGLSVTHPYKERVIPYLSEPAAEIKKLRSCNTLLWKNNAWHGINTDVVGFEGLLVKHGIELDHKRIAIIGAGGSARAAAFVISQSSAKLIFLNRTDSKALELAAEFGGGAVPLSEFASVDYDVLIQTTPVGMRKEECPIDPDLLKPSRIVIDVLYEPAETLLFKKAKALGCQVINGEDWFVSQAEAQFQYWLRNL